MDVEEGNDNTTDHCNVTVDDVEEIGELESGDSSTSDRTLMVDPNLLIGSQVIDTIMSKPEFSFLIRYYSLLYQSLIPNCKLTINTLRQHISISDNIEQYIVGAACRRTSCQRLINFLLTRLYSEKDYMQFCYHLNIISVMTDLPCRLIAEFCSNGNWRCNVSVHPRLSLHKSQPNSHHASIRTPHSSDVSIEAVVTGALSAAHQLNSHIINNSIPKDRAWGNRASRCSINSHYHHISRRRLVTSKAAAANNQFIKCSHKSDTPISASLNVASMDLSFLLCSSEWRLLGKHFHSLCNTLPHKLKAVPLLSKDGEEQLNKMILSSSATNVGKINQKIITYFIVKLCYSGNSTKLVRLSDVIGELIVSTDTHTSIQQIRSVAQPIAEEHQLPKSLHTNKDFTELKVQYHNILQLLPDNYELTVGKLLDYINDDKICAILSSGNSAVANKIILDCLIERMTCKEELLDLCHQLENVAMSHDLKVIINEIRFGVQQNIQFPISTAVTMNTQSILSAEYDHLLLAESIEASRFLSPLPVMTTFTNVNATISQQFTSFTTGHHTSHATSVIPTTATCSASSVTQLPQDAMKPNMQENLRYESKRLQKGFKYLRSPPLLSNHVNRQTLLDEIATKLLQATIDPSKYEATLTITGAGGFGKTTTAISLCHHCLVKENFTDGFAFIELGPQATDPKMKLRATYNLLAGEQCDINIVEQKINQLTSEYYHNLLVIIDDIWHVEDAEPLVRAFSNCKTVLTTRMNDIEKYIPSKQSVIIGPMTQNEAISLLTSGVVSISQLSQEDVSLLDELAQDVHLWPLLLSLIRGQLSHNLKQYHLPYCEAIQNVRAKLHHKGLTAFDKNNIEAIYRSRKLAVKACIEITLDSLTESSSNKLKSFILYTGIGTSLEIAVLNILWNIPKQEAEDTVEILWAFGLVQFIDIMMPPSNITKRCAEVHAVISQYIIECMDSNEALALTPLGEKLNTAQSVVTALQESYRMRNPSSLTAINYLKYKLNEIEKLGLPCYFKQINMATVNDPHALILILEGIKDDLMSSPCSIDLSSLFNEEIDSLISNCKQTLKDAHILCRKLNQNIQRILCQKNYDKLIQTIKEFIKNYPLCNIAQKAAAMVKKIILSCNGELLKRMVMECEQLQIRTCDYHYITTLILPHIMFYIRVHKQITSSLLNGSPDVELTHWYFTSGRFNKEQDFVKTNDLIKLQEVAPDFVQSQVSQK